MLRLFRFLRTTTVLGLLCLTLAVSTVGLALRTVTLGAQVTTMTAGAAATAIANRRAIAAAVVRTKAKARLRRVAVAVPVLGIAAVAEFERRDYLEWLEDNPDGTFGAYSCEVAALSAEVADEVLQELPEVIRPSRDTLLSALPECADP